MNIQSLRISIKVFIPALALTLATPAMAQFAKPEDAIKYRQSAFALMGACLNASRTSSVVGQISLR